MNTKTFHLPGTIGLLLGLTVPTMCGETIELRDRHGIPLVELSEVKMFRYSEYFKADVPEFQANVRNLTGTDINVPVDATIHYKNGTVKTFEAFTTVGLSKRAVRAFTLSPPYTQQSFERVTFAVNPNWASPEDERRNDAEKQKQSAALRARARANCARTYNVTANKKVSDVTVKEAQEIRNCQALDLYPPH